MLQGKYMYVFLFALLVAGGFSFLQEKGPEVLEKENSIISKDRKVIEIVSSDEGVATKVESDEKNNTKKLNEEWEYSEEQSASLIISDVEIAQVNTNISEVAKNLGLEQSTVKILEDVAKHKAILDKNRDAALQLLLQETEAARFAMLNGVATDQDSAQLDQLRSVMLELKNQKDSEAEAFSDSVRNALTSREAQQLKDFESSIVEEKGQKMADIFTDSMAKNIRDLTVDQKSLIKKISSQLSGLERMGNNRLGFSLQKHNKSSAEYGVDVSAYIIGAAEQLEGILTYDQKNQIGLNIDKIRESIGG